MWMGAGRSRGRRLHSGGRAEPGGPGLLPGRVRIEKPREGRWAGVCYTGRIVESSTFISTRRRRRRTGAGPLIAVIASGAVLAFVLGFWVFWGIGSRVAGGQGLGLSVPFVGGGDGGPSRSLPAPERYDFSALADLRGFRDLSYVPVKGIYLSGWAAGHPKILQAQLDLADRTEINAMVIDVKDATGYVSYDSDVPLVNELKLEENRIKDLDALMATLREHEIVPIARIVCFNDPLLAGGKPELAIRHKNGGVWRDKKGSAYTNPYNREVWEYLLQLSEEAADRGFREIQFDYVRFPSDGTISDTVYPGKDKPMEDQIAAFLAFARERLEKKGVWVSADVFGLTLYEKDDMGIGQKIEKVARNVDIVSPMIYPSHYYSGHYNIKNPNANPYEVIKAATADATRRLEGTGAIYRPWLQDFSLKGMPPAYGPEEVRAQIKAVEEQGYNEWILWDPSVKYTEGALQPQ